MSSASAEAVPGSSPISAGRAGAYVELCRLVLGAGLLAKRPGCYRMRIGVVLGLWAAGWAGFALLGRSWWQLAVAALLAVVFTQVGFLCHDAGHRQVFIARHCNDRLGLLCGNLLIGLSRGWWTGLHDRRHAHPDQVGRCPDIAGAGRARLVESVLLAVHFGGYLGAVFLVLPVGQAVAFIAVHRGMLAVYLGCWFALSHRGMPLPRTDERLDFLRRQVLTRRNIHGRRWQEVAMGGLNHQIEHHLFPSMPSPTLHAARPLVRAFCLRHELPYHEITLASACTRAPRHLRGYPSAKDHPTERS